MFIAHSPLGIPTYSVLEHILNAGPKGSAGVQQRLQQIIQANRSQNYAAGKAGGGVLCSVSLNVTVLAAATKPLYFIRTITTCRPSAGVCGILLRV